MQSLLATLAKDNAVKTTATELFRTLLPCLLLALGATHTAQSQTAIHCTPSPSGLVGWWPGDGTAADLSGGNHGVSQGGAGFQAGKVGQGFAFTTPTSSVRIAKSAALVVGVGNGMTIELWINPDDVTRRGPLVEWNNGLDLWGAHFWILPNQPGSGLQPPSTATAGPGQLYAAFTLVGQWYQIVTDANVLVPHVYQHVALTYDKDTGFGRIYRNGVLVAEQALGVFTPQTGYDVYLGQRPAGPAGNPAEAYQGLMDEVSVYNRALSGAELLSIYHAGAEGKCRPLILNVCAALTIDGPVGSTQRVDYTEAPGNGEQWLTLTNLVLPSRHYLFIDVGSASRPKRFYRTVPVP